MENEREFFRVNASKYDSSRNYDVVRPSSLSNPKSNSVMFVTESFMKYWEAVLKVNECIVIWPEGCDVPKELSDRHVVIFSKEPRYGFANFFVPTSAILMIGLSYLEIPYNKYLKYIWKFLLIMLIIILLILLIVK